jgi:hypothetical protein
MLWPQTRIANGAGLWEKHGLTVNQTLFATGREAMQALLGGQADVAEVAPTPLVLAAFADQPVRAFAVVARWSKWRVLVRTDRGIATPSDLKGKKIGISVGTSSDLAFSYFLETNGLSKSSVEIVNVSPPDMIPALDSGSVDAINIWQPFTYEAEVRLGPRVKGMPYTFTNNYLLLTTNEVAAKNPELLKRTLGRAEGRGFGPRRKQGQGHRMDLQGRRNETRDVEGRVGGDGVRHHGAGRPGARGNAAVRELRGQEQDGQGRRQDARSEGAVPGAVAKRPFAPVQPLSCVSAAFS